ncbi:hypothetical protein [Thermodesulfatator atlanticus]
MGKLSRTVALAFGAVFLAGCAIPQPPSALPDKIEIPKGDIKKYKKMGFNEFMRSLPVSYSLKEKREIDINCRKIRPKHKRMCSFLARPVVEDFMKQIQRELEIFCVAKGGYISDKTKTWEERRRAGGFFVRSCKRDGEDFFGYVSKSDYIKILTPEYFKLPFEVFVPDPYIEYAKKIGLEIEEKERYFVLKGERDKLNNFLIYGGAAAYEEEGVYFGVKNFIDEFVDSVLFPNYRSVPKKFYKRLKSLKNQSKDITKRILFEDYPNLSKKNNRRYVYAVSYINVRFFGTPIVIPMTAYDEYYSHILIFKADKWKKTFDKIANASKPLIDEYRKILKDASVTPSVPKDEEFSY